MDNLHVFACIKKHQIKIKYFLC